MPTTPVTQQQATPKVTSASDKPRQKHPSKPNQVDGANALMDSDDNSDFNSGFEFDLGTSQSGEEGASPSDTPTIQHSVQGDTCHLPPFLLVSPSVTTKRKVSRKLRRKQTSTCASLPVLSPSLHFEGEEREGSTFESGSSSGRSDWRIPQLDGPHGDSSSENEEEEESDEVTLLRVWVLESAAC